MSNGIAVWVVSGIGLLLAGLSAGLYTGLRLGASRHSASPMQPAEPAEPAEPSDEEKKGQFLTNLCHELRAPLSNIIGFSHLMLDGADSSLTSQQRDDLTQISTSGHLLLRLVNDLVDFSKIEAGRMNLEIGPVDLGSVIREVVGGLRSEARAKSLTLDVEVDAGLPLALGDVMRVRQVLTNLVSNAIKFTEQGGVIVSCGLGEETLEVVVADTGIGITAAAVNRIFDEFTPVGGPDCRRLGGTGLGLALARRLLQLQGGEVGVESQVGQGSRFWFRLPVSQEQAIEVPIVEASSLPGQVTKLLRGSRRRTSPYLPG